MLDLTNETPILLKDVPASLPRKNGKPVHVATIYRWCSVGVRGAVLEATSIGAATYTTKEALARFFAAIDDARCRKRPMSPAKAAQVQRMHETARRQRSEAAAARLASKGW